MKITGYTEIDDETYDENLRLAFSDFIIDDDSIDKAISDLKKAIKLLLSNID